MISAKTLQTLKQLHRQQAAYRPNPKTARALQDKSLIMLVGATCQGKSTVMSAVAAQNPTFGIAGTITTRPPRPDDDDRYTYYDYSDDGLQPLLGLISRQELVQYAINPYSWHMYGSALSDYPFRYNLADIFASSVADFRKLGFRTTFAVSIISDSAHWLKRLNQRFPPGHNQRRHRLDEAMQSLRWSLAQTNSGHYWVHNIDGQPEHAAQTIIDIVNGAGQGNPDAQALAEQSLAAAEMLES